jgi:putative colanic acid biosynthesis UDP-glucose lipid carrier transferase
MISPQRGLLRPYSSEFSLLIRLGDAAIIWLTLHTILKIFHVEASSFYEYGTFLAIIFYFLTAEASSIFRSSRLENYGDIAGKIVFAWTITSLLLIITAFITKTSIEFSRLAIITWLLATPTLLMIERIIIFFILRRLRTRIANTRNYAILGNTENTKELPKKIQELAWTGLTHCGTYHHLSELINDLEAKPIDYVFIAYSGDEQKKIIEAIHALNDSTASIYLVPDLLLSDLLGSRWIMLGNTPLVVINDHPFYGGWWALKKVEDLLLGSLILILISPLMLIIAIAIKLSSPGPVLFRQRRHGLHGEVINVLKFRTMTTLEDGDVIIQATQDDLRITHLGKFLRRYSLDELPQFFNVLSGDMSIVGPRPHALAHNDYYRTLINGYMQRHKVKPGITGWAQINGLRGETDTIDKMKSRVEFDMHYINHWSLGLDLKIILLTVIGGFAGKTAY